MGMGILKNVHRRNLKRRIYVQFRIEIIIHSFIKIGSRFQNLKWLQYFPLARSKKGLL